jgi:hypothetical protein
MDDIDEVSYASPTKGVVENPSSYGGTLPATASASASASASAPAAPIAADVGSLVLPLCDQYVLEGLYMCKKRGRSGRTPAEDLLPYFQSQNRYFYLLWPLGGGSGSAGDWRIVYSVDNLNTNIYRRGELCNPNLSVFTVF